MFVFDAQTMSDRIVYVPVEWIMKNLAGSADRPDIQDTSLNYDDEYVYTQEQDETMIQDIVNYKVGACGAIIDIIEREGFRIPIVINVCKWTEQFSLGNGHHRFTSAVLMFLQEIPVYFATDSDFMHMDISTGDELEWNDESIRLTRILKEVVW